MKPTQVTELFANIRATAVSFFSILMFVALGVGIFLGILWAGPALYRAMDAAFDADNFHHFQIAFPYGVTEDDMAEIASLEGVSDVEGSFAAIAHAEYGSESGYVKVQSLPERIDTLEVLEGQLPESEGQVAVLESFAEKKGVALGSTIELANADKDRALLRTTHATVTGIVRSPEYISENPLALGRSGIGSGDLAGVVYAPQASFDTEEFRQAYPVVNVRFADLEGAGTFGASYEDVSRAHSSDLEALGSDLAAKRYASIHDAAQEDVDAAQSKLDDARDQLDKVEEEADEGEQKLDQAREEAASGQEKIEESEKQLSEGLEQIAAAEDQIEEGRSQLEERRTEAQQQLDDARAQLDEGKAQLEDARAQLAEAEEQLHRAEGILDAVDMVEGQVPAELQGSIEDYTIEAYGRTLTVAQLREEVAQGRIDAANAEQELAQAEEELERLQEQYNDARVEAASQIGQAEGRLALADEQLEEKRSEAAEGQAQIDAGKQRLEEGQAQIAEKEQELESGKEQIDAGERDYTQASEQLEAGKAQLASMKEYAWTVMPRSYNGGVAEVSTLGSVTRRLSLSMALLFVLVGLLVCYSAVSRIVHEQVTQIGTKKALGLRGREITASFLGYSGIAVVAGAVVGIATGTLLVEGIINPALGQRFYLDAYPPHIDVLQALLVTAAELVLILGATWLACRRVLKKHAVDLLRGEEPPAARPRFFEKWSAWEKLPLFTKTMVNNCLNEKRRVFSTVVGVAGCTALIVTALTLNDNVLVSYDRHYENVYGFDTVAYTYGEGDAASTAAARLNSQGIPAAVVHLQRFAVTDETGDKSTARVMVPEDPDAFAAVYHINSISGGQAEPSNVGVWVSRAFADHLGAKVGDSISIDSGEGTVHRVPIAGFYEFYLAFYEMVMSDALYQSEFGAKPDHNAVLFNAASDAGSSAVRTLEGSKDFESVVDDKTNQHSNFASFSNISRTVVLIYMVLAVLMAVVVLLNLNVMFIDEKKRELIVLMINGFSVKDAKRYITGDNVVLTVLGILLGVVFGVCMGAVTVGAVEPNTASFVKSIDWKAVGVGVAGSAVLSAVMSAIALRRIPRFELTDINRF